MVLLFLFLNPDYGILHILQLHSALIVSTRQILVVHRLKLITAVADGDKTQQGQQFDVILAANDPGETVNL